MKTDRKTILKLVVAAFILFLAIHYWPAVSAFLEKLFRTATPLLVGGAIAFVVNLLMSFYERFWFPKTKKKWLARSRRPVCMVLAMLTMLAIVVGALWLVVPQLISGVTLLISRAPSAITRCINWMDGLEFMPGDWIATLKSIDWQSRIGELAEMVTAGMGSVMSVVIATVSSVFSGFVTALLSIIVAVYLLLTKETLLRQIKRVLDRYLPEKINRKVYYTATILNDCFARFISGQCIEALILGLFCLVGMLILQLPYAPMIAALIAVTALIPVAGAYIGGGVGAFLIFTVSPVKALIFVIFLVLLQQLEGNLIYPRVVGKSLGLPPLWVLAAVILGGGVMGIFGMLIAVPLTATLWQILRNDLNKKEQVEK